MTFVGEKLFSLVPPRHGCAGVGVNSNSTPLEAKLFYTNYPLNTPKYPLEENSTHAYTPSNFLVSVSDPRKAF